MRAFAAEKKKDAQQEKITTKIVFSDLRNPPKNFTLLFGKVKSRSTRRENKEQKSNNGGEVECCVPQTT